MSEIKSKGGRPPKFTDPAEMKELVDAYFEKCDGEILYDNEGNPVLDKFGRPIIVRMRPYTTAGLALALGFKSRKGLYNYKAKQPFMEILEEAMTRIEMYAEERLFDKDGSNGAKFSLQNNFSGWNDAAKETATAAAATVKIINDIPRQPPATDNSSESADDADTQ
ncbi:MAG: terminase small subunit [Acutalibacteraceae bacterium]